MKIVDLYDLLENNQIENRLDKLIVEKIIKAERDWIVSIPNLNEFITILKKETGNSTSINDLKELLKEYTKFEIKSSLWKRESICYLLEIFDYSGFSNLKLIFTDLSERLRLIKKINKPYKIKIKGYPAIILFEEYFEIRAIDYWKYRMFKYSDLKELKLVNPLDEWWYRNYVNSFWFGRVFAASDPIKLKVIRKNNKTREYLTSSVENLEFYRVIKEINSRIVNS